MRKTLALVPLLSACGGLGPGDYAIYRVASAESTYSEGCFPDGEDENEVDDTTTFRTGQTLAIFAGAGGTYYLEVGSNLLEGHKTGSQFVFTGESVDIEHLGASTTGTQTTTLEVRMTLSNMGGSATGAVTQTIEVVCDGSCGQFEELECETETEFDGTRVRDIDLEHAL